MKMEMPRMRTHLVGKCAGTVCRDEKCPEAVKRCEYDGRHYITMGHAGFNLPANNGNGYANEGLAKAAMMKCLK
jgi:hypothetical protein